MKNTKSEALIDALASRGVAPGNRWAGKAARHSLALQGNRLAGVEGEPSRGIEEILDRIVNAK
jgi:hypothetical protein